MKTRSDYLRQIGAATHVSCDEEAEECEQAMALLIITQSMAHRRIPFQAEAIETTTGRLLQEVRKLIDPDDSHGIYI